MDAYTIRLVQDSGADLCVLPKYSALEVSVVRSDSGSIKFDYPINGTNAGNLAKDVEARVLKNGVELRGCHFLLEDDSSDDASEEGKGKKTSWTGRTWVDAMMDSAIIIPPGMGNNATWVADTQTPGLNYTNATPGAVLKDMIDRAKGRGCFPKMTYDFTATKDSAGAPWPAGYKITKNYDVGTTYLQVLADLRDLGFIEYEGQGRVLKVYAAGYGGTMERDYSIVGPNRVILRKGRDLTSAPRQSTVRGVVSQLYLQGDQGKYATVTAAAAESAFRREGFSSEGGIIDTGTLTVIGQQRIQTVSQIGEQKTLELAHLKNPKTPKPWDKYYVGDWIITRTGTNGAYSTDRVVQLTLSIADDGTASGSVVLNDLFSEKAVRLLRKIEKIENGYTVTGAGSSGSSPSQLDATTPLPPDSLTLTSDAYQDGAGKTYALITASWAAVVTNTDGTAVTDLGGYRIKWRKTGDAVWSPASTTTPEDTNAVLAPLALHTDYDVAVRAYDYSGHLSTWTVATVNTSADLIPPAQPSTPIVDGTTLPALLRITWDGKDYLGDVMPFDWNRTEVHVSTVSNFVPDNTTLRDAFVGVGGVSAVSATPGITYYVKLVPVDNDGNRGTPSAQASGVPRQTADGEISSMTISKLTGGYLSYDMVVGGRIKTADTGARVELNAAGIQVFDTSGTNKTFDVSAATGAVSITGGTIATSKNAGNITPKIVINPATNQIEFHTGMGSQTSPGFLYGGNSIFGPSMIMMSPNIGQGSTFLTMIGPYTGNPNGLLWIQGGLYITQLSTIDVSLTSKGNPIQIGPSTSDNLVIDDNEIQRRNNGAAATLNINISGGNINLSRAGYSTEVLGQLIVDGATNFNGGLTMTGRATIQNGLSVSGSSTTLTNGGSWSGGPSFVSPSFSGGMTGTSGMNLSGKLVLTNDIIQIQTLSALGSTGSGSLALYISSAGNFQKASSSRRYKQNMRPLRRKGVDILTLEPKEFRWRTDVRDMGDTKAPWVPGLIAEEVVDAGFDDHVWFDEKGLPGAVHYDRLTVSLLAAVKELSARLEKLEAKAA